MKLRTLVLSVIIFKLLLSCSSQSIVVKTKKDFNEKRVAVETFYEFGPTDFLRSEYAKNSSLTESKIASIANEMRNKKIFFAGPAASADQQGQMVLNAGDEVAVKAKVYIAPLGDFFKIETTQGLYLIKDTQQPQLVSSENYKLLQTKNAASGSEVQLAVQNNTLGDPKFIDYFNSDSEQERLGKIKWFCDKYPQYKKFQRYAEKKQLTIGMPEHLLGLSWGQPAKVAEEANDSGVYRSFYYPGDYLVITKDTVIKSWKKVQ